MNIQIAIKHARIEAGYSQDGLAYLTKMPRTYISKVERGCITPGLDQISRIALALGVTTAELVGRAEQIESVLVHVEAFNQEQVVP